MMRKSSAAVKRTRQPKKPRKAPEMQRLTIQESDREALCEGVIIKMRPIVEELELWRKNSMSSSMRL